MRIGFDLDGVITDGRLWPYPIIRIIGKMDRKQADFAQFLYLSSLSLKNDPHDFLAKEDKGFIITARKPGTRKVTKEWLQEHKISLPVIFIDKEGKIDWDVSYEQAATECARLKAQAIRKLKIEVYFEDDPLIVEKLRKILPEVKIILFGKRIKILQKVAP